MRRRVPLPVGVSVKVLLGIVGIVVALLIVGRLAVADVVIANEGSLEELDARVTEVWADLLRRAARG